MKKIIIALFMLPAIICTTCRAEVASFLTEDEMLTGADFLPTPPKPSFYRAL